MTGVKYIGKKVINQQQARDLNPEIQDTVMFSFEVKILLNKDDIEKIYDDSVFDINDNDAGVSNWFRGLYMLDQGLDLKSRKHTK